MSIVSGAFMVAGSLVAVLAGIGVLRFSTPYARFHAAGKASPIAFLVAAIGAGMELGYHGAAYLIIGGIAMVLTLPVGVHLLFRAVHSTTAGDHLVVDELAQAEAAEQGYTEQD
ncbi:MAG: cation:proton antiporter [Acidimicrobiales bacterium]